MSGNVSRVPRLVNLLAVVVSLIVAFSTIAPKTLYASDSAHTDKNQIIDSQINAQAGVTNPYGVVTTAILGCMKESAANYNVQATDDDGSCINFPNCSSWESKNLQDAMNPGGNQPSLGARNALRQILAGWEDSPEESCKALFIPSGTYNFRKCGNRGRKFCGELSSAHSNIYILGSEDTDIIIDDPSAGFLGVYGAKNVHVQDLSISHSPYPFTQGQIVGLANLDNMPEGPWIDIEIQTGKNLVGFDAEGDGVLDENFIGSGRFGFFVNDEGKLFNDVLAHSYPTGYSATLQGSRGRFETWRIVPEWGGDNSDGVSPNFQTFHSFYTSYSGNMWWVSIAKNGSACFRVNDTPPESSVVFKNITINTCRVQSFGLTNNEAKIALFDITVQPKVDAKVSTNGGVVLNNRHRAPLIVKGGEFRGVADDGININSREKPIMPKADGSFDIDCANHNLVYVELLDSGRVREGDTLQFTANFSSLRGSHQYYGTLLARGLVVSAEQIEYNSGDYSVTYPDSKPVRVHMETEFWDQICAGSTFSFAGFDGYSLFNESDAAPESQIIGNEFALRGTGVHNIGVNSVIHRNHFERGVAGISVGAQHQFGNQKLTNRLDTGTGPYPIGLIIDRNTFQASKIGRPIASPSAVQRPNALQLLLPMCTNALSENPYCNGEPPTFLSNNRFIGGKKSLIQIIGGNVDLQRNSFFPDPDTVTGTTIDEVEDDSFYPLNLTNSKVTLNSQNKLKRNRFFIDMTAEMCKYDADSVFVPDALLSTNNGVEVETVCEW